MLVQLPTFIETENDGTSQERWKRNGGNNGKEDAGEFEKN
jgi:hypothetical protein